VEFGAHSAGLTTVSGEPGLRVALPVLAGPDTECLLAGAEMPTPRDGCSVFATEDRLAGFAVAGARDELEAAARVLYHRVFAATRGLRLHRIWNYVPQINAQEDDLENYRRFCRGRSLAFEDHFGHRFQSQLPAASAVGATRGPLAVAFLAGQAVPRHSENPRQVPAFEYPPAYGPRPPSFSRATLVNVAGRQELFISGTAAIRGHATVAPYNLTGQLTCTRENLHVVAETAGAGPQFGAKDGWQRTLKVYVRHETDFAHVREDLERHLIEPDDIVTYLQADLCRADLLVEIEALLIKPI
jgi:enamine deaminase RidA (YjgF/YER057c/UK114 family)